MKRRFLAWMTAICMLTMVVAPIGGTWATEKLMTEAPTEAPAEASEPTQAPAPKDEPTAPSETKQTAEPVKSETPVNEASATEVPATEAPATEAPATEAPATEAPATEAPATDAPATEAPATEVPATEAPATEAPSTEAPATDAPATEVPVTETPTVTPTESPTAEPTVTPESDLSIELGSAARYAFANEDTVNVPVSITGSYGPFAVALRVACGGSVVYETSATAETAGSASLSYMPTRGGEHTFTVTVTDATGAARSAEIRVPVAVREAETRAQWERTFRNVELTKSWRENLINIAKTQLGYQESATSFIIREDGTKQGYTRYGDWYGSAYEEWCAMFVSFCLNYAEIPERYFPREASCNRWRSVLSGYGAYMDDEDGYAPISGDLIFFNWENENEPQHVGIVESVSEDTVYTIEGNSAGGVRRCQYSLRSGDIVGYGSIAKLMARAGLDENGEPLTIEGEPVEVPENVRTAATNTENVNMRSQPSTVSEKAGTLPETGTIVEILSAETVDGQVWYYVQVNGSAGYIRGDLLKLIELQQETLVPVEPDEAGAPEEVPETEAPETGLLQETLVPVISVSVQPESAAWRPGTSEIGFTFVVEDAASYTWQQSAVNESGETVWTDIPGATESTVRISADMESLRHSYRCVAVNATGYTAVSDEVTMLEKTLVDWMNAAEVSEEMLLRALNAKSLEAMVIEEDALIYVRNGKAYARYDAATGYLIDDATGLIVARVDLESGMIYPVASDAE